jgi:hypothetical protein
MVANVEAIRRRVNLTPLEGQHQELSSTAINLTGKGETMRTSAVFMAAALAMNWMLPSSTVGQEWGGLSSYSGDIDDLARSSCYYGPRFPAFFSSSCQPGRMSRALYRYQLRQIRLAQEQPVRQARAEANHARYERVKAEIESREFRWWGENESVFARLQSMNSRRVVVVEENGRRQELPVPELSEGDRNYILDVRRGWQ